MGLGLYADSLAASLTTENFLNFAQLFRALIKDSNLQILPTSLPPRLLSLHLDGKQLIVQMLIINTLTLCRVIKTLMATEQMEHVPSLFKEWLSYLPLSDEDEMIPVYKDLCYIW